MNRKSLIPGLCGLLAVAGALAGCGPAEEPWDAFVKRMGEYEKTRALEQEVAALIDKRDNKGFVALAARIRKDAGEKYTKLLQEGYSFEFRPDEAIPNAESLSNKEYNAAYDVAYKKYQPDFAKNLAELGLFESPLAAEDAILRSGPCEMAGILMRNIVLQTDNGSARYRIAGEYRVFDGTNNDELFLESMRRCEIIERIPGSGRVERFIGYSPIDCLNLDKKPCPDDV
jgi:hypothetical protein